MNEVRIVEGYEYAKEVYGELGVDVDAAVALADGIPISLHSWQGDDLIGFDGAGELTGGIAATGNYPGRARSAVELRADLEKAMSLIPGEKTGQPSLLPRRDRRDAGRPRRLYRGTFPGLARLGEDPEARPGFQPDLLLPSEDGRQLLPDQPGQGHEELLDRARPALPRDRRGVRKGPGKPLHREFLDARRIQGCPGGHRGPPCPHAGFPRPDIRGEVRSPPT